MNEAEKICPVCGQAVSPEHVFCRNCGTDVGTPRPPEKRGWSLLKRFFLIVILIVLFIPFLLKLFNFLFVRSGNRGHSARQRACLANMRVIEGAIDMWEMDNDTVVFGYGGDCEITSYNTWGKTLVPNYIKRIPRCKMRGSYRYHHASHHVWCTRHNTVESPMYGTSAATGP